MAVTKTLIRIQATALTVRTPALVATAAMEAREVDGMAAMAQAISCKRIATRLPHHNIVSPVYQPGLKRFFLPYERIRRNRQAQTGNCHLRAVQARCCHGKESATSPQ